MNIYDIAKEAGVSISTVSKYLNNKNIRPELKARVEAVIKKYNYVPSAIAQGLVSRSMKTIAVMVVDIRLPHYSSAAFKIDMTLSPLGYRVIICNTLGDVKNSINYIESMLKINVDGIIFVGSIFNFLNNFPDLLHKLDDIPIVCNNGKLKTKKCVSVFVDDKLGVATATKYLISKGRKNIHYIQYLETKSATLKADGYREVVEKNGLPARIHHTSEFFEGGYKLMSEIISNREPIDAVICGEDLVAMGAISCLKEANIVVGKEVDVIGYNASEYTNLCDPRITSVDNLIEKASMEAAQKLLKLLEGTEVKDSCFEPVLIRKNSA